MSIVDWDAVREKLPGGADTLRSIALMLPNEAAQYLEAIRRGLADGNAPDVDFAAHRLKNSVNHFGLQTAVDAASLVEKKAKEGDLQGASDAFPVLEAEVARLLAAVAAEDLE